MLLAARALEPLPGLLPVPWPETALAARVDGIEVHTVHVPNAANGAIKPETLAAVRAGLAAAGPRVLCGDLNTPRREQPDGTVWSFARDSRGRLREERAELWDASRARRRPRAGRARVRRRLPDAPRLGGAVAELDVPPDRGPRRRLAARPRVRRRAGARRRALPPRVARARPERPRRAGGGPGLGAGGRGRRGSPSSAAASRGTRVSTSVGRLSTVTNGTAA